MKGIRFGLVLSTIAVLCFLWGCAEMAPSVPPGRKRPSVSQARLKEVLSLKRLRSSRSWLKREAAVGSR